MAGLKQLIHEIHRRSLWQVLAIYGVASWVIYEMVEALTSGLGLPQWFPAFAIVLLLLGLPIVLATAFVQEGISATKRHDPSRRCSNNTTNPIRMFCFTSGSSRLTERRLRIRPSPRSRRRFVSYSASRATRSSPTPSSAALEQLYAEVRNP